MLKNSPFPFLLVFFVIIGIALHSNIKQNEKVDKPIYHTVSLKKNNYNIHDLKKIEYVKDSIQLAYIK